MSSRRPAIIFFVTLCLVLCGLVLRRQIAAHPLPHEAAVTGRFMEQPNWHPADASAIKEAKAVIQGQLDAFHAGDGAKAMAYQSREMRSKFSDPVRFEQLIVAHYPEFGRYHRVLFGPIFSDPTGELTIALVLVEGENGNRAQGQYQLKREDGKMHINGMQPQWVQKKEDISRRHS